MMPRLNRFSDLSTAKLQAKLRRAHRQWTAFLSDDFAGADASPRDGIATEIDELTAELAAREREATCQA